MNLWQVFWLVPFVDAFPSETIYDSGVVFNKTILQMADGTYSCGYSSGFSPDSHFNPVHGKMNNEPKFKRKYKYNF